MKQPSPSTVKAVHNRKRTEPLRKSSKALQEQLNEYQKAVVEARAAGTPHPVLSEYVTDSN